MTTRKLRLLLPLAVFSAALAGNAEASRTTMATGFSLAGPQDSAAAYRNAVEAALAAPQPGYGTAQLPAFDAVNNHQRFGITANLAYHFTVEFTVTPDLAGPWQFRAGVDFGKGGTLLVDDTVLALDSRDLWWEGSWSSPGVLSGGLTLNEGLHTLHLYGLEGCCDGYFTAQFSRAGGAFVTFSDADGLLPVSNVPEPSMLSLLAAGTGVLAVLGRRRRRSS